MAFLVSPGVAVREIDLTTIVPNVSTTEGAIGGVFRWGPIDQRVLIDSENELVKRFGKPTNLNAETWFTAASFLGYGNRLYVSRAANTTGITPSVSASIQASNSTVVLATGNTSQLAVGLITISSSNSGLANGAVIQSIVNSTAFTITDSDDAVTSSAANTYSLTTVSGNTTVISNNTTGLANGMVIIQGNINLVGLVVNNVINSTAFYTTVAPSVNLISNNVTISAYEEVQFVSNTVFTAVANTAAVANLEYQIVKNETHFTQKENTFDSDVKFIARFPGEVGNSLRVSVCGNGSGYTSNVNLASYGVYSTFSVNVNSNTAVVYVASNGVANAYSNANQLQSLINVTDQLEVGNTTIGVQYLKVTSVGTKANSGTTANSYALTTESGNTLITSNNTTGVAAGMLITEGNTALVGLIVNNVVNSTAFYTTVAPSANLSANVATIAPTTKFTLSFEDQYKLSLDYSFVSSNSQTRVFTRYWEFFNLVDAAPGQSDYVINFGNSSINSDELHVVVVDEGGKFTGVPGTVLETYRAVSRATDAKTVDGGANHWKTVINDASQYVYAVNDISGAASTTAESLGNSTLDVQSFQFNLGRDGKDEINIEQSVLTTAYDMFASAEDVDVSLILQGKARSFTLANYLIDNIAEKRKDCIVLVSPQKGDVVNNVGNEADAIVNFRNNLRSTSYGVLDSGYKYMYDRYNDIYRWIPLNGDTAGLCVRTDQTNDPWWSPAGFNRGQIKNIVKLAYNPRQADRDTLYKAGINPVVTFPGQGTVLFGDKTLLAKPSAFDRINVRRLFIVLEKAIATASKFTLFEFNDAFTRSQFKNLVVPYLRDVKGRRGVYDFLVVCDETNNTPEVIDRNEFIGDIYIKPARSINFIQLNFVAVRTGVAFEEVVGKF